MQDILSTMPPEIIDSIIDIFPPTRDALEPIALVSKLFVAPCQRRLLSSISLWDRFFRDPDVLPGTALLELLDHSPQIGGYISTISIYFTTRNIKSGPAALEQYWVYSDNHLIPALQKVAALRHLKFVNTWTNGPDLPEGIGPIIRGIQTALQSEEHLVVLESLGMPPKELYHALSQSPNLKHLSYAPREFPGTREASRLLASSSAPSAVLELFSEPSLRRVQLTSLAIFERKGVERDTGSLVIHMERPQEDLSFVHQLDLSKLKKLFFGCETMLSGDVQEDFGRILKQCAGSLEELRAVPSFRNSGAALAYLQSPNCPRLDQFPSLRVFETCLYATEGRFSVEDFGNYVDMDQGPRIFEEFADSFLSTASPSNTIEYIRLYVYFDDMGHIFQPEGSIEANQDAYDRYSQYARVLGLHHLDRALGDVCGNFGQLKKVTIVVGQRISFRLYGQDLLKSILDAYKALFADWQLKTSGRLEVVFQIGG
ncbi:hypothetical protein BKA70DRAFT_1103759 [Coprinopsis sp. MPI-PUGE-AT-0042]|nr:hypothetical protein BKA70DRAFT_1103759 [Coprinopsis sp. MPI-PUGE-AT-0042]